MAISDRDSHHLGYMLRSLRLYEDILALCVRNDMPPRFTRISQRFGSNSIYFYPVVVIHFSFLCGRRLAGWLGRLYDSRIRVEYGTATARYRAIVSATRTTHKVEGGFLSIIILSHFKKLNK